RLVQGHRPEVLRGPVVEGVTGHGNGTRAAVWPGGGEAVRDGGGGRGDLPGGSGSVLALGGPVQDRLTVTGPEQVTELPGGDAAGPDGRIVGRVAGHRDHLAAGGHHHRRAGGRPRVALRLRTAD